MKGFNKILLWRSARCAMNQGRRKAGDARLTVSWLAVAALLLALLAPAAQALTDPLVRDGLSETPTLASLQEMVAPVDNLSYEGRLEDDELADAVLPVQDIPEVLRREQLDEADAVHRMRELEDPYSIVFQNRDGTMTLYSYEEPVQYIDQTGQLRDKSNRLVTVDTADGGYINGANDILTKLPYTLADTANTLEQALHEDTAVVLTANGIRLSLAPVSAALFDPAMDTAAVRLHQETLSLTTTARKLTRTQEGKLHDSVAYIGSFGNTITLEYTPTYSGFKENIILAAYTGVNAFTFRLRTNGLVLVGEEGNYRLADPDTGETQVIVGDIAVFDSAGNGHAEHTVYDHRMLVEAVEVGQEYLITLVVDIDFLTDEGTQYPVTIDPYFTVSTEGVDWDKTICDVPVYSGKPTTNYGNTNYDDVGYFGTSLGTARTLVKFPGIFSNTAVAALNTNHITSFKLNIRALSGQRLGTTLYAYYHIGNTWEEDTATYTTAAVSSYGNLLDSYTITGNLMSSSEWCEFELKNAVTLWKTTPEARHKGILLVNGNEFNADYNQALQSTRFVYGNGCPYVTVSWTPRPNSGIVDGAIYRITSAYNKSLTTLGYPLPNGVDGLRTEEATDDGYSLWRITYRADGYYSITSCALRHDSSQGEEDMRLACGSYNELELQGSGSDPYNQQAWCVVRQGNKHYFLNAYAYGALLRVDSGEYSDPAHLGSSVEGADWTLTRRYADAYKEAGKVYQEDTVAPYRINFVVEDQAIDGKFPFSLYQEAGNAWNGICSNISVGVYRQTDTNIPSGVRVDIFDQGLNVFPDERDGLGYYEGASDSTYILEGNIYIDTVKVGNKSGYGYYDRRYVVMHEMGHALMLSDMYVEAYKSKGLEIPAYARLNVLSVLSNAAPSQGGPRLPSAWDRAVLNERW